MTIATVAPAYQGLWRRTAIRRSDGSSDTRTAVWWLQSPRFHVDLRIPAERPALLRAAQLASLPAAQVAGFAAQTGFAGSTYVDGARCTWQPEIAFPTLGDDVDAGIMRFDSADALHETGIDGSYDEDWRRTPTGAVRGVRLQDKQSDAIAYLLVSEHWMAWACGRRGDTFHPHLTSADAWSEFTILHKDGDWKVAASNFPWLEATPAAGAAALEPAAIARWKTGEVVLIPFRPRQWWRITDID